MRNVQTPIHCQEEGLDKLYSMILSAIVILEVLLTQLTYCVWYPMSISFTKIREWRSKKCVVDGEDFEWLSWTINVTGEYVIIFFVYLNGKPWRKNVIYIVSEVYSCHLYCTDGRVDPISIAKRPSTDSWLLFSTQSTILDFDTRRCFRNRRWKASYAPSSFHFILVVSTDLLLTARISVSRFSL